MDRCGGSGRRIERRAASRPSGNASKRHGVKGMPIMSINTAAGPIGAGQIAFQFLHLEGEIVAIGFRRGQCDDGILYGRSIFAEHRDGGVRRVLAEAVATLGPFLEQMSRIGAMASRADRTVLCQKIMAFERGQTTERSVSCPFGVALARVGRHQRRKGLGVARTGTPICLSGFWPGCSARRR